MKKYEFRDPSYVGVWTRDGRNPIKSTFMAFVEWSTCVGDESTEGGRMFDYRGVSDFKITKKGADARVEIKYIPSLSEGYSGEVECTGKVVEGFVTGKWNRGEFSATRFENAFLCKNPSTQLLSAREYDKLAARVIELAHEAPLPICNALRGVKRK